MIVLILEIAILFESGYFNPKRLFSVKSAASYVTKEFIDFPTKNKSAESKLLLRILAQRMVFNAVNLVNIQDELKRNSISKHEYEEIDYGFTEEIRRKNIKRYLYGGILMGMIVLVLQAVIIGFYFLI